MKFRLVAAGVVAAAFLAACNSSVSTTPSVPVTPTPPPTVVLKYAGTMVQTYAYAYGYPSPEPPATIRTKVTDDVTVTNAAPVAPFGGTQTVRVAETDATSLQSTSSVTDAYTAQRGGNVFLYGSIAKLAAPPGGQSTKTTTLYATAQTISKSSGKWTNSPAAKIDEAYGDGHDQDRTIAANGTYTEKGTTFGYGGAPAGITIAEQSTGSGRYTGPFGACPDHTSFEFAAPAGSPPEIVLKLVSHPHLASCSSKPVSFPAWFAANPPFYAEADAAKAHVSAPAVCGSAAGMKTSLVERAQIRLDTVIGYVELTYDKAYRAEGAPVCLVFTDAIANYYDWQGDTPDFVTVSPDAKPVSTIVTAETLTSKGGAASAAAGSALAAQAAAGAQAHFAAKIDAVRATLRNAMLERLAARGVNGGVR